MPLKKQDIFKVIYTGTVHKGRHDPTLLFKAIAKLNENGVIDVQKFRVQFYVPKNWRKNIVQCASYEKIKAFVDFYDYVDTSEVPGLLNDSAILLLLSNLYTPDGPKGLISTTKYFEYLAVERPILCVRSDESLLAESIHLANAGKAASTVEQAYEFLLDKWNEWVEHGYTTVSVNREYVDQFSRKKQAEEFVEVFEKTLDA
jgi:glycosyltransferase involved in cell wall biosynthesis